MVAAKEVGGAATIQPIHGWWHYWLVVNLPAGIRHKLLLPRQAGCMAAFLARDGMENTLIRWMQRIFSQQRQFTLTLDLVKPLDHEPARWQVREQNHFQELRQQLHALNPYLQGSDCPAMQFGTFIQWKVPDEWYHQQQATETIPVQFSLEGITLFRKPYHTGEGKEVQVFGLKP
jgi:hypothetical protein